MSVKINLGCEIRDFESGETTENLPLRSFKYNLLLSGKNQSERSALLSHILNQIYLQTPDIGVLLIKLSSDKDLNLYRLDNVFEYGEPKLEIPYSYGDEFNEVHREQFEKFMTALFGFHYEMKAVIGCLIRSYRKGNLPSSIVDFLEDLKKYWIKNPYDTEFTTSNVKSIEKTIDFLNGDAILERTLWFPLHEPEWLRLWGEGKAVCLDLSACSIYYQKILVTLMFQAIQNYIPMNNSTNPTGIIALDSVDDIFKRAPHEEYKETYDVNREHYDQVRQENYFLTKEQIEEAFGDEDYLLNSQLEGIYSSLIHSELRYRNLSLITVCQDPSKIYQKLISLSQTKLNIDK